MPARRTCRCRRKRNLTSLPITLGRWAPALIAVLALVLIATPISAQQRSGSTVLSFLEAVDQGDIDAALYRMLEDVEVTTIEAETLIGKEAVRPYLTEFPRPIEIRRHNNLRRMAYEAYITAGGTPMKLTFRGAAGIAAMRVEADEPIAQGEDNGG